jgi:hypothetical protein
MVDLRRGSILDWEEGPLTGKPVETEEADSFVKCPACAGMIDCRDLAIVLEHLKPLPHPGQDATN